MLSAKDEKTCIACPLPFCVKACYTTFIIEKYALEGEIPMVYESSASSRCAAGPKIAAIGGGTGLSTMLRGLKKYTDRLTAIVTVADDGGGSGVLRREMGILPPGDVRQCMQALANTEPVMEQLLGYRFPEGQLKGQSFGNLLLAALNGMAGSFEEAVAMMGQVLAISGRVLPVTNADVQLEAVFENGARVVGESHIFNAKKQQDCRIHHVSLVPEHPKALPDALHAISEADLILLGPGSLYTSVIPNLLVDGVADTIRASHAQKFYICNIMTQDGETEGYTAADHLEALQRHGREGIVDLCLANNAPIPRGLAARYSEEDAELLRVDRERIAELGIALAEYPLLSYGRLGFHVNWQAALIGLLVVAVMVVWPKKWGARVPGSLVGIIAAAIVAGVFHMNSLATVGDIPRTLLLADRLELSSLSFSMVKDLLSPIVTIAALGMIESLLCGASASRMKGEEFNADQELIAQGVGNILLPLFGGVPATAAIARTSVAVKSGQQTRLTSVFHSVFLLASMFLLGGVMARLPLSALAGVLMVTAWRMNDWAGIRYVFRHKFKSGISQFLLTMIATVVFDLTVAILLGVVYSAILYMAKSSQIRVSFSAIDTNKLRAIDGKPPILESAGVAYVTGALFFGAVDEFNHRMAEMPAYDHVILSMRGMPSVDVSGAQAILELCQSLLAQGKTVACCGMSENVRRYFDRAGITEVLGESAYFWSADQAILDLLDAEIAE